MARKAGLILFVEASQWRFAVAGVEATRKAAPFAAGATPAQAVSSLVDALRAAGVSSAEALLAIPSGWCLSATVPIADLPAKSRRRAMVYRFEESLPLAAEEVRADFVESADAALGVAVARRALDPWLAALKSNGVRVQAVCPAATLDLQGRSAGAELPVGDAWRAVSCDGEIDLFRLRDGRPVSWSVSPAEPGAFAAHLRLALHDEPGGVGANVSVDESNDDAAAWSIAEAILSGRAAPWVDLLRGEAETSDEAVRRLRRPLMAAVVGAAVFTLCAAGAMLIRAGRYDRAADASADAQRSVFKRIFPAAAPPADVRSRLASEERSLRAAGGEGALAATPPSGLLVLRDLLSRLPDSARYRVQEVRVDEGKFTLEGQAKSHDDADAVAAAVSEGGVLAADSPRTEQAPGLGVSFTLGGGVAAPRPREKEAR